VFVRTGYHTRVPEISDQDIILIYLHPRLDACVAGYVSSYRVICVVSLDYYIHTTLTLILESNSTCPSFRSTW
jgi:hypothetical protein